jgi:hypothetical protein
MAASRAAVAGRQHIRNISRHEMTWRWGNRRVGGTIAPGSMLFRLARHCGGSPNSDALINN